VRVEWFKASSGYSDSTRRGMRNSPVAHSRQHFSISWISRASRALLRRVFRYWKWIALTTILLVIGGFPFGPWFEPLFKAYFPGKTKWDYIELVFPAASSIILGLVVLLLQERYSKEREAAQKEDRATESLQHYFDRIEAFIVDRQVLYLADTEGRLGKEYRDPVVESARDVIRARTLSILRTFSNDIERKNAVMSFLIGSEILTQLQVSLKGADLSKADLRWASLVGVNLCSANLRGAILTQADMGNIDKVKLIGGELESASLQPTNLIHANLEGADLYNANLEGAWLQSADLSSAILTEARLKDADLSAAKLIGADLRSAHLIGARLRCADLSGADLSYADLREADLEYAKWDAKTLWPDLSSFLGAKNVPPQLKKHLGLP
jgi:uncharacterized protein YjbI with pentapeptide repeats